MSGIWVISDIPETAWELLSKARELVEQLEGDVTAYVIGDETVGKKTVEYGADKVKLMEKPQNTTWEQYAKVLVKEAEAASPQLILVGATRRGKDLAAQLASLLDSPCVTECKGFQVEAKDKIVVERIVYGGLAAKKMEANSFPLVATIGARSYEKLEADASRQGEVSKLELAGEANIKLIERQPKPKETVNISEANIVVGVGRGFSEKSELKLAEDLAQALGGEIGCSRPIAEDLHWLPEDRYIGISGQIIKPTVYLSAGVSGQVQHVYGIRDSKIIVAVDKNENAPIFQVADYYIVGDIKEVLPELTKAVAAVKGN